MPNQRVHTDGRPLKRGLPRKASAPQGARRSSGPPLRKLPAAAASNQKTKLRARLKIAEDTLHGIQSGEVDALVVSGRLGAQVVSLKGGEPAYRVLVEAMSEGAATLSRDGVVLYCNGRIAELIGRTTGRAIGIPLQSLVAETERDRLEALLTDARKAVAKGEFRLRRADGSLIPVYLSLNRLRGFKGRTLGMVITDLSEQKRKQAEEIKQAEATRRLLLERTLSAQEEERRWIARELHDETGQLLTALLLGLRTLENARTMTDVKTQGKRLREIATLAIDEVGRLARGLHPAVLEDHGLSVAFSRYAAEFAKTHKIAVNLTPEELDSRNLPPEVQIALYRILQEAMTNAARHSRAKAVSIRFARLDAAVEVEIIDDGCGFDAKAVAVSSHRLGIQSMRERAAMLGGTISFIPQRKGTKILVQVPLARHNSQPTTGQRNT
jgi:PAS domain S-box-containing protein